jgi:hypothetical protein
MTAAIALLDEDGSARALFTIPRGGAAGLGAADIHHAFIALDPVTLEVTFTSNALHPALLPCCPETPLP